MIITTEKVSSEAKLVFEELSRSSDTGRPTGAQRSTRQSSPVLIEGLSSVRPGLMTQLERASFLLAATSVREVAHATGFDIAAVINTRYSSASTDTA